MRPLSRGAGPIHEYERSVFDQTIEMCLTNTLAVHEIRNCRHAEKRRRRDREYILQLPLRGQAYNTAYAAAKGGVNILHHEFRRGIRRPGHSHQSCITRRDPAPGWKNILRSSRSWRKA
ncbi:MAG: hypothetical protein MZV70_61590 [Desulfobacterales bacterium]|nr:hypothetical protein [Desulfobacterales bacterium]